MYRGLILCHPKIVSVENGKITNHWYSNIIQEDFSDFEFDTVDIRPGGTYVEDCFSDKFINSNVCEYDLLLSPDAGGEWYTLQESKDLNSFKLLICNLLRILKSNCIVIFDKFIYPEFRELTIKTLEECGFRVIPKTYDMYGHSYKNTVYAER